VVGALHAKRPDQNVRVVGADILHDLLELIGLAAQSDTGRRVLAADDDAGEKVALDVASS